MDHTLLKEARPQVFHGAAADTPVVINGSAAADKIPAASVPGGNCIFIDLSAVARRFTGRPFVSAASAAAAAKCSRLISLDALVEAVRLELGESGMAQELIEQNVAVAREIYALTPPISFPGVGKPPEPPTLSLEAIPQFDALQSTGPTIRRGAGAALRRTGSWRTERPEIALGKCKRCFLCYVYCPDGAIRLDGESYPHIDYEQCKGCMICYTECPAKAIMVTTEA
jgi:2-oxoacid:acceptor oxidoreductase delta subunit (pyruvate/2-ketoisovalerate family)